MKRLDGRVAIVTGGTRGIGKAIASAMAAEGASVVVTGRDPRVGNRAVASLSARPAVVAGGGRLSFLEGDVAEEARCGEIVAEVLERHNGRLDILVNNAAVQIESDFVSTSVAEFHAQVNANLLGNFLYTRAVLPTMLGWQRGVIINLSSVLGLVGEPVLAVYSATKAGILGLTRSVAAAYGSQGIRAVAICPGDIDSSLGEEDVEPSVWDGGDMRKRMEHEYPMKRWGVPDEVARVAVFLASDDASYVTGSHVLVDGGIMARLYDVGQEDFDLRGRS